MQELEVKVSHEAADDILEIAKNIEQNFGKERADRFQNEIRSVISKLSYTSMIYGDTGIFYRDKLIYKKHFLPSLIFYYVYTGIIIQIAQGVLTL
ncbi:MAG: type II toxin-antitoxin system RelE/ParE family toxin [Eubacterium sp.]|nr:type II toxin-antitoxin system RelE/ParE family toxin [Eubacterium sp.]